MHRDVEYRVPPAPGSDHLDPRHTLQVIHDDHTRLGGRVVRLKSKHAHAESPRSRTRRFVTNVRLDGPPGGDRGDHGRRELPRDAHPARQAGPLPRHLPLRPGARRGAGFLVRERVATLDHGIVEAGGTVSIIL